MLDKKPLEIFGFDEEYFEKHRKEFEKEEKLFGKEYSWGLNVK